MYEHYTGASHRFDPPPPGTLIVLRHQVFRVIEVNPVPEVDWTDDERKHIAIRKAASQDQFHPVHVVVRPAHIADDNRGQDKHFRYQRLRHKAFNVYPDEHYPMCAVCHEPMPCRDTLQAREARKAIDEMSRYEDPNRCPECGEVFTRRQKTRTFDENIKIPAGPPVTYHLRRRCYNGAYVYAKRAGVPIETNTSLFDEEATRG